MTLDGDAHRMGFVLYHLIDMIHTMTVGGAKMRDFIRFLLAVALALMSIAGIGSGAVAAPDGSISGCVQSDNGTPIGGAHVVAYSWETDIFVAEAQTSENGTYSIAGLTLARYRIRAEVARYLPEYYRDGTHTPVTVIPPFSTDNIDFTLTPGSSISGHVYQDDKVTPISGARVAAYTEVGGAWKYVAEGCTDSKGSYSVTTGTDKGIYRVRAQAAGFSAAYYSSIPDYAPATGVYVSAGGSTAGINFTLTEIGFISGTVYGADGVTAISGAQIAAYDNATGEWVEEGFSGANAGYYYINLRPGTYRLKAEVAGYVGEWYADVATFGAAKAVSLVDLNEEPNINFILQRVLGITTRPASNLTTTSARLRGSLISLGTLGDVTVSFIWGTATGSYPLETPRQVRNSEGPISFELSGLIPGMTYYYKAKAAGNTGAVYGEEKRFTTVDDTAPVISLLNCITTASVATITWTTSEAATSQTDFGLTEDYGDTTGWSADLVTNHSVCLVDLSPDSTYHYRIMCRDASRNKVVTRDYTFSTDVYYGGMASRTWKIVGFGVVVVVGAAFCLIWAKTK
jgi:hypothetical protein